MKFALGAAPRGAESETPMDFARAAEQMGFDSVWTGEHIFLPVERTEEKVWNIRDGDVPDEYKSMVDPFIAAMAAAAVTTRLKVGTFVALVPQRNPLITAKE